MKYTSYILSFLWVVLVFNIFLSYSSESYRVFLKDTKSKFLWVSKNEVIEKMNKDQIEVNTKILNSIDKLNENIEVASRKNTEAEDLRKISDIISSSSWETVSSSWEIDDTVIESDTHKFDLPATLLTKLLPEINPKKIQNSWVFWIKDEKFLKDFDYATYSDLKKKITIYVFDKDYSKMKSFFWYATWYKLNETDTFFWFTFFLNSIKNDQKVRFVMILEWIAIWFETDKSNYDLLKKNILN